jgi:plastocyanin
MKKQLRGAAVMVVLGCGDGGGPGESRPATVLAAAGQDQIAAASTVLPDSLAVVVRDAAGAPLPGVTVSWNAATGGGAVSPASNVTNAAGLARAARTLSANAGTHTTTATVAGLQPVTFTAVAQIQGATQIGSNAIGPLADTVLGTLTEIEQPLIVVVRDQNDVPVRGVIVHWEATGGGSVAAATGVTDAGGQSIMEYTFGPQARGNYGARASVPGLIGSPVEWTTLSAHPGNPVSLEKTNGDGLVVQAGGQVVHTVTVLDSYGNGVQGVAIAWAAAAGGGSVASPQSFTATGGRAEMLRTLGAGTGEQTTTASAATLPGSPQVTFSATAATAVVLVRNNAFVPAAVSVARGDSVAWQWDGTTALHNITFAAVAGAPASEPDRTSGVVWRTFATVGAFSYQCTNHGGMSGTVTVTP